MHSDTIYTVISIVYILVCLFLIAVVLLQSGKGGGMGALGGGAGGGGQTVFGGAGAGNFLTRLTAICAALFMILSATLAYLSTKGEQEAQAGLKRQEEVAAAALTSPDGEEDDSPKTEDSADEPSNEADTAPTPAAEPTQAVEGVSLETPEAPAPAPASDIPE